MLPLWPLLLALQSAASHKCFVCGPEAGAGRAGAEDRYQLQKMFGPAAVIPACSTYRPSNRERFLISCPAPSSGCLTKFQAGGSVMRTCAPIAIEDCKQANGINYCYCKAEGCNTPERKLSDPVADPHADFSQSAAAAHSAPATNSQQFFDDEDLAGEAGSGDWGDFYYDEYMEEYGEGGGYRDYRERWEPPGGSDTERGPDGAEDGSDVTDPPPFLDLEKPSAGPNHKFDRDRHRERGRERERTDDIIIIEEEVERGGSGADCSGATSLLLLLLLLLVLV